MIPRLEINVLNKRGNVKNTQLIFNYSLPVPHKGEQIVIDPREFFPIIPDSKNTLLRAEVSSREFHIPTNGILLNITLL